MNFLISFCLNNRITVILLTIALAIISIFVVKNIPVDVFPELKVPRVTIQTEAPGLTAEEVEQYITIPAFAMSPRQRNIPSSLQSSVQTDNIVIPYTIKSTFTMPTINICCCKILPDFCSRTMYNNRIYFSHDIHILIII